MACVAALACFGAEARAEDPAVTVIKQYVTFYVNGQGSAACGHLTDKAKQELVKMLAPKLGLPLDLPLTDCATVLDKASKGLELSKKKDIIISKLPEVTFTVTPSPMKKSAVMDNVHMLNVTDPEPVPVNLYLVGSAWKINDGFEGVEPPSDATMAPLTSGFACLGNKLCELLGTTTSCFSRDLLKLDPTKPPDLSRFLKCLPKLCQGKKGIADPTLVKPTDDLDGDGLSNAVELLLMAKGKLPVKPDVCDKDTDDDGIADAYDLIPGSKGKGLRVDVTITEIRQEYAADGNILDDGATDGRGDPWIADAVLSTGLLTLDDENKDGVDDKKRGRKIEFDWLTRQRHIVDPEMDKMTGVAVKNGLILEVKPFKLIGGPVVLSEDVTKYPEEVAARFVDPKSLAKTNKKTGAPLIGLSAVFLDEDWDFTTECANEVYVVGEPNQRACKNKKDDGWTELLPKYNSVSLAVQLFGAGDAASNLASWAAQKVSDPMCVPTYGLTACFRVSVSDANGKPLDPCALGIATAAWKNFTDKLGVLKELPTEVLTVCKLPK